MAPTARETYRRRTGIKFNTDPALIAGAEITLPSAILRFNWRDALTVAAKAINRNEHAG